jgi:hypothetical protein
MTALTLLRCLSVVVLPLHLLLAGTVPGLEQKPTPSIPPPDVQTEPEQDWGVPAEVAPLLPPPTGVAPATHAFLSAALASGASEALDDRRRALLRTYFSTEASLAELAPLAGVRSRQRVQQLLLSGLRTLWEHLPAPLQRQYPLAEILRLKTTRGRSPSAETRAKLGAARRGQRLTPETRAKLRAAHQGQPSPMQGRQHTPEARAKMSAARQGRSLTDATRAKISAAKRGHELTAETRAKISAALRGRPRATEGKARRRERRAAAAPSSAEQRDSS